MSSYTIPNVVEQTPRGERAVDLYSRLLSDRIVYLGTEIDDGVANAVIAQLLHLESENPDSPISLYLNSPGGSITAMLAIYDTMQFVRAAGGDDLRRPGGVDGGGAARRRGARAAVRSCRTAAWCCTSRPRRDAGTLPDLILEAKEIVRVRAADGGDPGPAHRAYAEQMRAGHRPRPRAAGAPPSTTASSTRSCVDQAPATVAWQQRRQFAPRRRPYADDARWPSRTAYVRWAGSAGCSSEAGAHRPVWSSVTSRRPSRRIGRDVDGAPGRTVVVRGRRRGDLVGRRLAGTRRSLFRWFWSTDHLDSFIFSSWSLHERERLGPGRGA